MKKLFVVFMVLSFMIFFVTPQVTAQDRGGGYIDGGVKIVDASGDVVGTLSQGYALVIGEINYNNGWDRLNSIRNEINIVKGLLEGHKFIVETLVDKTSDELQKGIRTFLNKYGNEENARLLVFFAGHGATLPIYGKMTGYIVPIDAPHYKDNERGFLDKAILISQFEFWANNLRCRHILFIFDSCFSGTIFTNRGAGDPPVISYDIVKPVRQFITAGSEEETTPPESILVPLLERALKDGEADMDKDGYISGTELGYYLRREIINRYQDKWHPQYGKSHDPRWDKGDFIFVVKNPGEFSPPPPPPPPPPSPQPPPSSQPSPPASAGKTYKIGDTGPAGGIIFFDRGFTGDGWRYLEAAPAGAEFTAQWGAYGKNVANTMEAVGFGKKNTTLIVERLKALNETNKAAQLCAALDVNGYKDWFLPSKDELDLMYKNLKLKGLGGFSTNYYWSSSQTSNLFDRAWNQRFSDGAQLNFNFIKTNTNSVRAVRAFAVGNASPKATTQPAAPAAKTSPATPTPPPAPKAKPLPKEEVSDAIKKITAFLPHNIAVGSAFSTPLLIVSVYNNYYLLERKMFFDYGCDFGFFHGMQDINDVNYYSFYPNLHINGNIPGDSFQLHGGLGIGYMISTYTFPNDTVNMNTFAFDVSAGIDISTVTFGYNLRTDFKGVNHKAYIGIRIPY